MAKPIRKRHRVSSHALYQSISVLRDNRLEKNVFQRDRDHIDGHRMQGTDLGHDSVGASVRYNREDAAGAADAHDPGRPEDGIRRVAVEYELDPAVPLAQILK